MKTKAVRLPALLLLTAIVCWTQPQQPGISVGGQVFRLGMDKKEALAKISQHGKVIPIGDSAVIVMADETDISQGFGGTVYFEKEKVSGIAADKDWVTEPAAYENSLAFYRLVDGLTHGTPVQVTVYSYNQETSNGSGKFVLMRFANGRSIRLQLMALDPGQRNNPYPQQVTVSECLGNCTDW